jgi:threonine dehydratase
MSSPVALAPAPIEPVLPTFADVMIAAERIAGVAHKTPVMTSRHLDERTGASLFFKCENLQRAGAFKFRGAYNALSALEADQRRAGVLAFSSGNHAQAIAYAGRLLGIRTTIVMPSDAPVAKVAATRDYGGNVVFYDRYSEDRERIGRDLAEAGGLALVPPFDHPDVIAGQGTAALELFDEVGPLDLLLVCLGGGGLLAGSALGGRRTLTRCRVIGVEPEAGDDGGQSFRAGRIVSIPVPKSIADGALTTQLGRLTFGSSASAWPTSSRSRTITSSRRCELHRAPQTRRRADRLPCGSRGPARNGCGERSARRHHCERRQRRPEPPCRAARLIQAVSGVRLQSLTLWGTRDPRMRV